MLHRGVLTGDPQERRYQTWERSRRMPQAWTWTERPCPMDSPQTVLFWLLKVREEKSARCRSERVVSEVCSVIALMEN